MERIFVFNLNVLQKLTLTAAEKHPQVPGKWQEHFISWIPQQDLKLGVLWNPSGARVLSLWNSGQAGKYPEESSTLPQTFSVQP